MASGEGSSLSVRTSGSLSWTDLMSRSVNLTVGILARVSAAGVDPYTVVVGQKLGDHFELTQRGRGNIIGAVKSLRSFQTLGRCLEVVFGITHLVRVMARTEEGMMCLSLCAALVECFDIMVAAEILMEMVNTIQAPDDLKPSILEWQALLKACAGTLAMSDFPLLAEKYMRLHPTDRGLAYEHRQGSHDRFRGCPSPNSLAKTLLAIGEVSRGSLASITVAGGANAGFLAAFCEWHFQLPFYIVHAAFGQVVHASRDGIPVPTTDIGSIETNSHIRFLYQDHSSTQDSLVEVSDRTYQLHDATTLIQFSADDRLSVASVAGRFSWSTVLSDEFEHEYRKIKGCPRVFGSVLGCLCRIAKAVAFAEPNIPPSVYEPYSYYDESSYGRGLASSLVRLFPELAFMKQHLDESCIQDSATALAKYESHLMVLKTMCNCGVCRLDRMDQEVYCLVLLAETLFIIARTMSCVTVPRALMPSRLGLDVLYSRQYDIREDVMRENAGVQPRRSTISDLVRSLGPAAYAIDARGITQFQDALTLYAGRVEDLKLAPSAVVRSGLCCFWSMLCVFNDNDIPIGQITIVPGQIEFNKKSYTRILDPAMFITNRIDASWPLRLRQDDSSLVIQEKVDALRAHYQLYNPALEKQKIDVFLTGLSRLWMESVGRVHCPRPHDKAKMKWTFKEKKSGYSLYEAGDYRCKVYDEIDPLQAVMIILTSEEAESVVLVEPKQCLDCCLKASIVSSSTVEVEFTVIRTTVPLSSMVKKVDFISGMDSKTARLG